MTDRLQKLNGGRATGLAEIFRLYLFAKAVPIVSSILSDLVETLRSQILSSAADSTETAALTNSVSTLCDMFLTPFQSICDKLSKLEKFVEHVVDMTQLPDLKIDPRHDAALSELEAEKKTLTTKANRIWMDARDTWAAFADVKLEEKHPQHAFVLRTTKVNVCNYWMTDDAVA
jgi:hypothetical protein